MCDNVIKNKKKHELFPCKVCNGDRSFIFKCDECKGSLLDKDAYIKHLEKENGILRDKSKPIQEEISHRDMVKKITEEGISVCGAKKIVGLIAEWRQRSYLSGHNNGFTDGYDMAVAKNDRGKIKGGFENESLKSKYNELIMAVHSKINGESRHQTALRYITEKETHFDPTGSAGKELEEMG